MVVKTSICKSVYDNKRCEVSENNSHLIALALYRTFYCDKRKYHRHFANILALFYTNGPRVENKKGIFLPFCRRQLQRNLDTFSVCDQEYQVSNSSLSRLSR